jgi:hypothetical protein
MKELVGYFPPYLLLALGSGLVVVALISLTLLSITIIWFLKLIGKKVSSTKYYLSTKLIGTLSVVTLAFAANNFFVYFFSTIIIATLITDLDFIEKVAAIISKSPDYFSYRKTVEQGKERSQVDLRISPAERERLNEELARDRDSLFILYHFEKTYRLIFGTQLTLLDIISKSNEKNISGVVAQAMYTRTLWPGKYSFENYMNFLKTSQLIIHNPTTDIFSITDLGEAFLNYLSRNQISLDKPF